MPWTPADAESKTRKADTPLKRRQWRDIANSELQRTGDEGLAIRAANGVIKKRGSIRNIGAKHGR